MKLIVGLGNPGREYGETRHNIGFRVVGCLAEKSGIGIVKKGFSSLWGKGRVEGADVILMLPQTFMNRSGETVRQVKDFYRIPEQGLMVVHDDLDLPLGRIRQDYNAGAAGHRGVLSIVEALGTKSFHRLRMGIGRPERKEEVEDFVLSPFEKGERDAVHAMINNATDLLLKWICEEAR